MMACLLTKLQRFESVGRRGAFSGFQRRAFVVRVVQMLEHEATFGALRTIDYNRFLVTVCLIFMLTAGLYKAQKERFCLAKIRTGLAKKSVLIAAKPSKKESN